LKKLDWDAIKARQWSDCRDKKQAELLVEKKMPWKFFENVGVYSFEWVIEVNDVSAKSYNNHKPIVRECREWYY